MRSSPIPKRSPKRPERGSTCLSGNTCDKTSAMDLIERAVNGDAEAGRLLFPRIVEPLADAFEPDLCNVYVGVFACIFGRVLPQLQGENLIERYERVRAPRRFEGPEPARVFVL